MTAVTTPGKVAVFAAFFATSVFAQEPPPPEKPRPAAPTIRLPLARLKPDSVIDITGDRVMTGGDDGVWVASRAAGTVTRIDAKTNKPDEPIAVGKEPCAGIVTGFASLIVPLCGEPGLARVELKTKKVTSMTRGFTPALGAPVTGVSSIWMLTDSKGTLVRIDPASNTIVAEIHLNAAAQSLTFGQNAIWAATTGDELLKINAYTNVTDETIKVGKSPRSIAIGEGSVWTLNTGDATVSRIDPKTNKVTMTIKLGRSIPSGQIVVGEGSVWVSAPGSPLIRIDPRTNRVVQHFSGEGGGAILIAHGALWITVTPKAIWRLDPKLVEATRE
jgi:YVTN family beta-propeller protein